MNYYPHHIGDYLKNTIHLSAMEDGAYRRMLDIYYLNEKPLPNDKKDIYRLVRATTKNARAAVDYVLSEFFFKSEDGYHNKRCDIEIAKFKKAKESHWSNKLTRAERNAIQAERNASKANATPTWLTQEHRNQINHFYELAKFLSESTKVPHEVDHIVPIRGKKVCGMHVPWNLRVITAEENRRKSNSEVFDE